MLLKNNDTIIKIDGSTVEARLVQEALEDLRRYANNGNVTFVLTDSYNKVSSVPIDLRAKVPAGKYNEKMYGEFSIRYFEVENQNEKGKKFYEPLRLQISGREVVNLDTNPELAYFLYACCPHCLNGKNKNDKVPAYFRLEQKLLEAQERNEERKYRNQVETMIMQPYESGGLSESDLRAFAKTIFIPAAAKLEIDILRDKIYQVVVKGKMYDKFLDKTKFDERMESKELASDLVTYNLIKAYDDKGKKVWRFIEEEGKPGERITEIPNKALSMHILAEKLFKDYDLRQEARSRLKAVLE